MYFADKFKRLYRDKEKMLYIHFTNATDTDILQFMMKSVWVMILQHNFKTIVIKLSMLVLSRLLCLSHYSAFIYIFSMAWVLSFWAKSGAGV
jgi:hypothetical protein